MWSPYFYFPRSSSRTFWQWYTLIWYKCVNFADHVNYGRRVQLLISVRPRPRLECIIGYLCAISHCVCLAFRQRIPPFGIKLKRFSYSIPKIFWQETSVCWNWVSLATPLACNSHSQGDASVSAWARHRGTFCTQWHQRQRAYIDVSSTLFGDTLTPTCAHIYMRFRVIYLVNPKKRRIDLRSLANVSIAITGYSSCFALS